MKGFVFNVLNKMVEEKLGIEAWDQMVNQLSSDSAGVYTSGGTYPDKEFLDLVSDLSERLQTPVAELVRNFGKYALHEMKKQYAIFFEKHSDAKSFLLSIDQVVHVEVKKLYPEAKLPEFLYEDRSPNELVMIYHSERKMCHFAEGLIEGTGEFFGEEIDQRQVQCMHEGAESCRFELKFRGKG